MMHHQKSPLKIHILVGSTRQGRYADKPAQWILNEFQQLEDVEAELVDLRDYPLPFFDSPASPMFANGQYADEAVRRWSEKVKEADGFVMISPEYNHSFTAVLKNAIDHLYPEWNYKPVGFLSYGGAGGARSVEQMRLVAIELQMIPIKSAIHIPADTYLSTMQLDPEAAAGVFTKSLRHGYRDVVALFTSEMIFVTQRTAALRSAGVPL